MTILLTGGTGKTATRLASRLSAANIPFLLASRRGPETAPKGYPAVRFDWTDETTWKKPFENASFQAIYMMEPQVPQPWVPMIKFVDFARERGVKRYVLCAGTTAAIGKDGMGRVWEHYVRNDLDFCVLRPPWFMDNLTQPGLAYTISQLNQISTACRDGFIPFISVDDIADVAFRALTIEKSYNRDFRISGPELLTYDDIAAKLSTALGRKIEHVRVDGEVRYQTLVKAGVPEYTARFIANIELKTAEGGEAGLGDGVEEVTGHPPKSFEKFVEENKSVWAKR